MFLVLNSYINFSKIYTVEMIIKLSIVGLIIVLIAVIAISHYSNKEYFENADQTVIVDDLFLFSTLLTTQLNALQLRTQDAATTQRISEINKITPTIQSVLKGKPKDSTPFYRNALDYALAAATDVALPFPPLDQPSPSLALPFLMNACAGVDDNTSTDKIPIPCAQKVFLELGCTSAGIAFPRSLGQSKFSTFGEMKAQWAAIKSMPQNDPRFIQGCAPAPSIPAPMPAPIAPSMPAPIAPSMPAPSMPAPMAAPMAPSISAPLMAAPIAPSIPAPMASSMPAPSMRAPVAPSMPAPLMAAPIAPSMPSPSMYAPSMPAPSPVVSMAGSSIAPASRIVPSMPAPSTVQPSVRGTPQVPVTNTGYAAMALKQQSDLLSGIQNIVHNELLSSRMTHPILPTSQPSDRSDSLAQGHDFNQIKKPTKGNIQKSDSWDQMEDSAPAPYSSSCMTNYGTNASSCGNSSSHSCQ